MIWRFPEIGVPPNHPFRVSVFMEHPTHPICCASKCRRNPRFCSCFLATSRLQAAQGPRGPVLQRSGVGGDLVLVFGQLHLVRGEGPAAVRIAVHFDDGALEAEVIGHLQADRELITGILRYDVNITSGNLI